MPSLARKVTLSRRERELHRGIQAGLREVPDVRGPAPTSEWLVAALGDLFGCHTFSGYRPGRDAANGWRLGARVTTRPELLDAYDEQLSLATTPFTYDPLHPEAEQANRVVLLSDIHTHSPDQTCVIEEVWPSVGIGGHDQLRALICEGSSLLAWVGGFREEPFTTRDRNIFTSLLPSLQRSLSLQRRLIDGRVAAVSLDLALGALTTPAFIVDSRAQILHASPSGQEVLDRSPDTTRALVRAAFASQTAASVVASIPATGAPPCFLVDLRASDASFEGATARGQAHVASDGARARGAREGGRRGRQQRDCPGASPPRGERRAARHQSSPEGVLRFPESPGGEVLDDVVNAGFSHTSFLGPR